MRSFLMFPHRLDRWMSQPPRPFLMDNVRSLVRRREVQMVLCLVAFFVTLILARALFNRIHWEGPIGMPYSAIIIGITLVVLLSWVRGPGRH